MAYIVNQIGKAQYFFGWLTACVTCWWAGLDNVIIAINAKARINQFSGTNPTSQVHALLGCPLTG